jgi:GrpB-like predicted nucleotidyltransferase (UPF0157 family)
VVADPILIVDYDPAWQTEFERLRERAARAVGEVAVSIEHVGSTAVPGLAAKPVIDLVVVVRPGEVGTAIERLAAIGYVHKGDLGVEGREAFGVPTGERRHHLYVCPEDSRELRAQLAFRDRLRSEPELASTYADLKRQLAIQAASIPINSANARPTTVARSRSRRLTGAPFNDEIPCPEKAAAKR